jgi:hypothetical protein
MKLKKLRTCLERLRAKKLVYVREDTRSGRYPPFYQMSGRAELKHSIRSLLKTQDEDLRVPETKFEENISRLATRLKSDLAGTDFLTTC